jgi:hypothetical protein
MQILTRYYLPVVVNGVYLPKSRLFTFLAGVEGADRDATFQGIQGFGGAFPGLQLQGLLVFFEIPVKER